MEAVAYVDKCVGLLLGGCVGDSLGMPWEGESSRVIQREVPNGPFDHFDHRNNQDIKVSAQVAGVDLGPCRVGHYTDDTECLLALADSLYICNGLEPQHSALNTVLWWCRDQTSGYSAWTYEKMKAMALGEQNYDEDQRESHGNGCTMRISPIGAVYRTLDAKEMRNVVKQAILWSHTHPEAVDASTVMALCISSCLKDKDLDLKVLSAVCETQELRERLLAIEEELSKKKPLDETSVFDERDKAFLQSVCGEKWFQIRAIDALTYVLYFFERYKQNPEEAMVRMIACGGDCDTLASMIGCLLGARYGKGWIPERWTEPLKRKDIVSMQGDSRIVRMKRPRSEQVLPDFVLVDESAKTNSLENKMKSMDLVSDVEEKNPVASKRRVFRHVATISQKEVDSMKDEDLIDAIQHRKFVKDESLSNSSQKMMEKNRSQQKERIKFNRLRVLDEKRFGSNCVLDVGHHFVYGKRRRDEDDVEEQEENVNVLCNGTAMKRVDMSLYGEDDVIDIFLEGEEDDEPDSGDGSKSKGQNFVIEMRLERFYDDDVQEEDRFADDIDEDHIEIDYPSSSSSVDSDRDEYGCWKTERDNDEEVECYDYGFDGEEDLDDMRHYDRTLYFDEEMNDDRSMPWNYWSN